MRILHRNLDGNAAGIIRVQAEQADDMYHLFNLIVAEDTVQASTVRNVTRESKTGSVEKSRMRMKLKIRVERVEFDAEQCSLRLTGKNVEEHEHVKMGQYHTLTLELDHPFTIEKACWDAVYVIHRASAARMRQTWLSYSDQGGIHNYSFLISLCVALHSHVRPLTRTP
jgi:protein pelota